MVRSCYRRRPVGTTTLAPGSVFGGKYRVLRTIGEGGAGVVYACEHQLMQRQFALKVLHRELLDMPEVVARFAREAVATAGIDHENIVKLIDVGQSPMGMYLVMELLEGCSLFEHLESMKKLPPDQAIGYVGQMLAGLAAAHERGIVHRDLKPENVFLARRPDGRTVVKLLDFGVAKMAREQSTRLTTTGTILGTPMYMAPEQARGDKRVDHRVDLHAAGVILFELLSGRAPFAGNNYNVILYAVLTGQRLGLQDAAPDLPPSLSTVVMRSFASDVNARFQSALDMKCALEAWLASERARTGGVALSPEPHRRPAPTGRASNVHIFVAPGRDKRPSPMPSVERSSPRLGAGPAMRAFEDGAAASAAGAPVASESTRAPSPSPWPGGARAPAEPSRMKTFVYGAPPPPGAGSPQGDPSTTRPPDARPAEPPSAPPSTTGHSDGNADGNGRASATGAADAGPLGPTPDGAVDPPLAVLGDVLGPPPPAAAPPAAPREPAPSESVAPAPPEAAPPPRPRVAAPRRRRRALAWARNIAVAATLGAALAGGLFFVLRARSFDVSDVAETIVLGRGWRQNETMGARIDDRRWNALPAEERRRIGRQLFEKEKPKGIRVINLVDGTGRTRMVVMDEGGASPHVSLMDAR